MSRSLHQEENSKILNAWTCLLERFAFLVSVHISSTMLKKLASKVNEKNTIVYCILHLWSAFGKFQYILLETLPLKPCKNYLKTTLKNGKNRHDPYIINLWKSFLQKTTWHKQKLLKISVSLMECNSFINNCLKSVFLPGYRWWLLRPIMLSLPFPRD